MSGAITALGDTLFPATSLLQGLRQDLDPTGQFLVRLRIIHPLMAIGVGLYVLVLVRFLAAFRPGPRVGPLAAVTALLVLMQWLAGVVNVFLLAPIWMQLVHLLLADAVWIALVLLGATVLGQPESQGYRSVSLRGVLEAFRP